MSRYHVLPRDSLESDREAHEYLIPSPTSNVMSASGNPGPRTCALSMVPSVILRVISSIFCLTAILLVILRTPLIAPFISALVFLCLILVTNCVVSLYKCCAGRDGNIRVAVYYKDRDLLSLPKGKLARPSFLSVIDFAFSMSLMISVIVAKEQWEYQWSPDGAIASSVLAYIVVVLQTIIAVPFLDRIGFTIRGSVRPDERPIFLGPDSVQPVTQKDRKEPVMTGAIETQEETSIPPPQTSTQDVGDLV